MAAAAALSTHRSKQRDDGTDRFALWQGKAAKRSLVPGLCVENLRRAENVELGSRNEDFEAPSPRLPSDSPRTKPRLRGHM